MCQNCTLFKKVHKIYSFNDGECCGSETIFLDPDPTFQIISDSDPVPAQDTVSDPAYFREKKVLNKSFYLFIVLKECWAKYFS